MDNLRNEIFEALDRAVDENGYKELLEWVPEAIACDLIDCNSDFEASDPDDLVPYVKEWLERRKK